MNSCEFDVACFINLIEMSGEIFCHPFFLLSSTSSTYPYLFHNLNQGQKLLDRLSLFIFIHPFTVLKQSFLSIVRWSRNTKLLSQYRIPPSHHLSQGCAQQWRPCQYSVDQHCKWGAGKSLINMPEWFNTFDPDYMLTN